MCKFYPPSIGTDMYEQEMFAEEYEKVVCDKCGKVKPPSDMIGNICSDCHMESIEEELDRDLELMKARYEEEVF